jgi:hypothetical protein
MALAEDDTEKNGGYQGNNVVAARSGITCCHRSEMSAALRQLPMGSNPLFLMAGAASGEARNPITEQAMSASVVLAATPAENTEIF